jgi:hypothetical protein
MKKHRGCDHIEVSSIKSMELKSIEESQIDVLEAVAATENERRKLLTESAFV